MKCVNWIFDMVKHEPMALTYLIYMLGLLVTMVAIGCTDIQPPPPLPETGCDVAAGYLEELECDELMIIPGPDEIPGTTDDWSWLEYCETVQESGIVVLNTDCLMDAGDCDAAAVCLD